MRPNVDRPEENDRCHAEASAGQEAPASSLADHGETWRKQRSHVDNARALRFRPPQAASEARLTGLMPSAFVRQTLAAESTGTPLAIENCQKKAASMRRRKFITSATHSLRTINQ